jgi:hypothetical protein
MLYILGPPQWLLPDSDERRRYPKDLHSSEIWIVRVSGNAAWAYERPSTFQAVMNDFFKAYLDGIVMVYIGDILIFSRTAADHLRHVGLILARLRQHKLLEKLSKCELNRA